jgi:uncharacterized caspase-like protein
MHAHALPPWRTTRCRLVAAAKHVALAAASLLVCAQVFAQPAREQCLAEASHQVCRAAAAALAPGLALQLGTELQARDRADAAIIVFETALTNTPDHRPLLQALIRARAQARAQRLAAAAGPGAPTPPPTPTPAPTPAPPSTPPPAPPPRQPSPPPAAVAVSAAERKLPDAEPVAAIAAPPPTASRSTACWTTRLQSALADCQRELARSGEGAPLLERIGDLQRSLGQGRDALAAYRRSAALVPGDQRLQRKISALAAVLGSSAAPLLADAAAAAMPDAATVVRADAALPSGNRGAPAGNDDRTGIGAGKFYALVIGNNRYRGFPQLLTASADARLVGDLLRGKYGFKVDVLENASRHDIINALSRLRRTATEADSVLVYYAGHGMLDEKTGRGYWLPVDAEADNTANWISSHDIADLTAAMDARHALIVADSCFSGALTRAGLGIALDEPGGLLQRLAAERSRTVLTSGGLEPVLDAGAGKHSIFARAFVDALTENQQPLEAARLFIGLRERVSRAAAQTPQYSPLYDAGHHGGDFVFVPTNSTR